MNKILFSIFCLLCLSACVADQGRFTVLTNKMIDSEHFKINDSYAKTPVSATVRGHTIYSWPVGNADLSDAMDKAIKKGHNTDMLTNVQLRYWEFFIPSIYGQVGWGLDGDAISSRK